MGLFYLNTEKKTPVKFALGKFMEWPVDCYDPLSSFMLEKLPSLASKGEVKIVGEEGKPWLVSFDFYANVDIWWIVMLFNRFLYTESFLAGILLNLPGLNDLNSLYYQLRTLQQRSSISG